MSDNRVNHPVIVLSIIFVKTSITCTELMTELRIYSYMAIPQCVLWLGTDPLQPCTARLAIHINFEWRLSDLTRCPDPSFKPWR